jgi:hypothetical protein
MSVKLSRIFLLIAVIGHFIFAAGFAMRTPYRQAGSLFSQRDATGGFAKALDIGAPDERQHANYIGYVKKFHTRPIFNPKSANLYEEYQSHQPPLYYFVASLVPGDVESQEFGRSARLLNCLIGAIGVVGTFFAALWGFKRPEAAAIAAIFQAFLPMNCALSGAISNDPLLITLCCWGVAFLQKGLLNKEWKFLFLAIAVSIIAFWTKQSGVLLLLTVFASTLFLSFRTIVRNSKSDLSQNSWGILICIVDLLCFLFLFLTNSFTSSIISICIIAVIILTVIVCCGIKKQRKNVFTELSTIPILWVTLILLVLSPQFSFNITHYGDPFAQKAFREAFVGSAQKETILAAIQASDAAGSPEVQYWVNWIGYWTSRSFIGVFGYADVWMNESGRGNSSAPNLLYKAIIGFNFAGLIGGLLYLKSKFKDYKYQTLLILILMIMTLCLFVLFTNTYFQAQARYLFPSISAFSIIMTLGWLNITKQKWQITIALVAIIFGGTTMHCLSKIPAEFEARISGVPLPRG